MYSFNPGLHCLIPQLQQVILGLSYKIQQRLYLMMQLPRWLSKFQNQSGSATISWKTCIAFCNVDLCLFIVKHAVWFRSGCTFELQLAIDNMYVLGSKLALKMCQRQATCLQLVKCITCTIFLRHWDSETVQSPLKGQYCHNQQGMESKC